MKLWAKLAVGVTVLAAGSAGGAWYVLSGNLVTGIKGTFDQINAANSGIQVSYAALGRTPFPTIGARLTDIAYRAEASSQDTGEQSILEWKSKGISEIIAQPWSHQYLLHSHAGVDTSFGKKEALLTTHTEPTAFKIAVQAVDHQAYAALAEVNVKDKSSLQQAADGIAQLHMRTDPMLVTGANGETLYSHQAFTLDFVRKPNAQFQDVAFALLLKDSLTTPAYQTLIEGMLGTLDAHALPLQVERDLPFASYRAGKQNIDIAGHLVVPKTSGGTFDGSSVVFNRFEVSNDFYHLTLPLTIQQQAAGSGHILQAKLDGSYTLTEAGGKEMQQYAVPALASFLTGFASQTKDVPNLAEQLNAAIPTLSTVGPVALKLDLEANLGRKKTPDSAPVAEATPFPAPADKSIQDQYSLNQFTLSHARWGIDAKGLFINPNDGKSGVVSDVTIRCLKCHTLMADGFSEARAVQEILTLMKPDRPQWRIDTAVEQQAIALMDEIGQKKAEEEDLSLAITTPNPGNVVINGKSVAEIVPKVLAIVDPEMAARMPTANGASASSALPQK